VLGIFVTFGLVHIFPPMPLIQVIATIFLAALATNVHIFKVLSFSLKQMLLLFILHS